MGKKKIMTFLESKAERRKKVLGVSTFFSSSFFSFDYLGEGVSIGMDTVDDVILNVFYK
jgi:hypothetical protein